MEAPDHYIGLHPHNAKKWKRETLEELEEVASDPQCVAIGECGLDFNRNFSDKKMQMDVFEKQVRSHILMSTKYCYVFSQNAEPQFCFLNFCDGPSIGVFPDRFNLHASSRNQCFFTRGMLSEK